MRNVQRNRNGIPFVASPLVRPPRPECINRKTGQPKVRFPTSFAAERYIAEVIPPRVRDDYSVYACGDHYHVTTQNARRA